MSFFEVAPPGQIIAYKNKKCKIVCNVIHVLGFVQYDPRFQGLLASMSFLSEYSIFFILLAFY